MGKEGALGGNWEKIKKGFLCRVGIEKRDSERFAFFFYVNFEISISWGIESWDNTSIDYNSW